MALGTFGSTLNDELNRLANGGTYRDMNQMVDEALAAKQWANRENINPYSTDTVGILNEIAGLGLDKKNWLDFNGVCNYIAGTTGLPAAAALRQVYPTTDLLTGVASYYVDATAPTNWGSLGYVYLNGVSGNYLSTPNSSELQITGDIDIRVQVELDSYRPSGAQCFISKNTGTNQYGYVMTIQTDGTLVLYWSTNGTGTNGTNNAISTAAVSASAGKVWLRATLDVDNGASGKSVQFFTSTDGTNWTQLGTTVTTAGTTNIFAGTSNLFVGLDNIQGRSLIGKVYRAQVLNGIGGTTVLDVNIASNYTAASQSFFTATTGQTVTVNGVDTITNLGAAGSLLPTTLGSSTAADSNDPKFLDHTGTNYVYLPGVTTSFLSVPNDSPVQITGDIDVRQWVALDDWTPSSDNEVGSKTGGAGSRGWIFQVISTGALRLTYSADGTTLLTRTSTATISAADGSNLWVRFTLDVDNGAGSNETKFFTSTDGTNWTQLGATVTNAGTTSIFNTTAVVRDNGGSTSKAGKLYRFQIFASIDGTDKRLDIDTSVITAGSATSFTAVTGQTVTINRSTSGRKTVAVTQPTWLFGTDDYMEVNNRYMSSGTYLYLPGVSGNTATSPDAAALDITGDIDIRVKIAMDDWTPSASNALIAKYGTAGQRSYYLQIDGTSGTLSLTWSANGTALISQTSSVAPTIVDGSTLWIRVTLDVDNGAGGYDVIFYTSTDGTNWTQLGTTRTGASTTSIFSGTSILEIGTWGSGNAIARGKFFRAQVRNGIDGTVAFDANFETSITSLNQTSFTESSANAATVTINRSGSAYRSAGITAAGYLYPGATNTFSASATDFLNFGASDSFTVLGVVRQWATAPSGAVLSKKTDLSVSIGYVLYNTSTLAAFRVAGPTGTTDLRSIAISNGTLQSSIGIRNTATDTISLTYNSTTASITDPTSSLSNIDTLTLGRTSGGSYNDMELYAAAVFRQALTAAQIRQIVNYFANREVYL
jgi:hypothetical protein